MKKTNKTILKVALVVLAAVLAVSAVLVFLKTRVQAPQQLTYTNQYAEDIHREAGEIANTSSKELEQSFLSVTDRIELFRQEGLLSNDECDSRLSEYLNDYVPAFRSWCDQQFHQSIWPGQTLAFMRDRIRELTRYSTAGATISGDNTTKLQEVTKVLDDYEAAWKLQSVRITNSSISRPNLQKARNYRQDPYLSNCTALMEMLQKLPETYRRSHHAHVSGLVNALRMSNFTNKSQIDEWGRKYQNAQSAVSDYQSAARQLYNASSDDFGMSTRYQEAKSGFARMIDEYDYEAETYYNIFHVRL